MRCTFHRFSVFVVNCLDGNFQVRTIRAHNFYRFPDREFVTLFNMIQSLVITLSYNAEVRIFLDIRIGIINLGVFIRFSKEKACCILSVRTFLDFRLVKRNPALI